MLRANVITLTGIIFNFEAEQTSIACVQAQVADVARRPLWMMPLLDRQNDAHAGHRGQWRRPRCRPTKAGLFIKTLRTLCPDQPTILE